MLYNVGLFCNPRWRSQQCGHVLPLPSLSPTTYEVPERMGFFEVGSVPYCGTGGGDKATNAMNASVASPNWLYLYNGDTLRKYYKSTGAYVSGVGIRTNTPYRYGGIDVDPCDNLFFGVDDSIYVMDSTFGLIDKIPLQDTVFDVHLGQKGALYACGRGYVTELAEPISVRLISSTTGSPSSCSACNGTATVNVNCGIEPFSFLWSNGSTNQTDTGLCAGFYTVTVTDGACPPHIDTSTVSVSGKNGYSAAIVDSNPNCNSLGNIIVNPLAAHHPIPTGGATAQPHKAIHGLHPELTPVLLQITQDASIMQFPLYKVRSHHPLVYFPLKTAFAPVPTQHLMLQAPIPIPGHPIPA